MFSNTGSRVVAAVVAVASVALPAWGNVEPLPITPGIEPSPHFRVIIDGKEVPVGAEKTGGRVVETAAFLFSGRADVRIATSRPFSRCTIRPLRFGLTDKATSGDRQEIRFTLDEPRKLIIEFDVLPPLALISSPPDNDAPNRDDPNVLYFGPGVHEPGRIRLKSNQTVYLAAGAKVYGTIEGTCVENVRVTGRGHLYGTKHTDWHDRTYALVFDRCKNVTVERIGIRDCYWWTTEFLLCNGVNIRDINILTFNRNNGGLMIDSCSNLSARDSLLMTMDDCICPHALNAAGNGEVVSNNMLFDNLVLYNVFAGNAIRIGASLETSEVHNWTFRNIDMVHRHGAAVFSDHSDWAVVRNLVFQNLSDEVPKRFSIDMRIGKTSYSCQTGYRDQRGAFDGLYFINVRSRGGRFSLQGFDKEHGFKNVVFSGCRIADETVGDNDDIETNQFVNGVRFLPDGEIVVVPPVVDGAPKQPSRHSSPRKLIVDDRDSGFRSYGFAATVLPGNGYCDAAHVGQVADAFGKYAAAIYEPNIIGQYEVHAYCGDLADMDERASWIVKHRDGYARAYIDQNRNPGWHRLGRFELDGSSNVRLVYPNYFEPSDRPVVADAVRFVRID